MSSKKFTTVLGVLLVLFLGYVGYRDAVRIKQDLHAKEQTIQQLDTQKVELNKKLDETTEIKEKTQVEVQKLEKEKQNLENERKRLEGELQAKRERKAEEERLAKVEKERQAEAHQSTLAQVATKVINAVTFTATASAESLPGARSGCGDNEYAAYIYGQESGGKVTGNCDTTAQNPGGCTGIGQSCPASKIAHCGVDYACQNAWFNQYAVEVYGSWAKAYEFHKVNGWW